MGWLSMSEGDPDVALDLSDLAGGEVSEYLVGVGPVDVGVASVVDGSIVGGLIQALAQDRSCFTVVRIGRGGCCRIG